MGKRWNPASAQRARMGNLLKAARKQAGLTQSDLAQRLGRYKSYVGKYERGMIGIDLLDVAEICRVLEISLTAFVQELEHVLAAGAPKPLNAVGEDKVMPEDP